jgi:hypothetical protein
MRIGLFGKVCAFTKKAKQTHIPPIAEINHLLLVEKYGLLI